MNVMNDLPKSLISTISSIINIHGFFQIIICYDYRHRKSFVFSTSIHIQTVVMTRTEVPKQIHAYFIFSHKPIRLLKPCLNCSFFSKSNSIFNSSSRVRQSIKYSGALKIDVALLNRSFAQLSSEQSIKLKRSKQCIAKHINPH